ncbi:hypothetical protein WN944_022390 [Citrus x changshan-huyou]|uniref:Uncharacterized protein n=1 Tax=Citrus x changshan-huyou TaxID=2935761 RepID=A0AAP0MYI5_9ROSI
MVAVDDFVNGFACYELCEDFNHYLHPAEAGITTSNRNKDPDDVDDADSNPADLLQDLPIQADDGPFNHLSVDLKNRSYAS